MNTLKTICADVIYLPLRWKGVSIDEKFIYCNGFEDLHEKDIFRPNPVEENPRFWLEVRQLYFDFQDKKWERIESFYKKYGAIRRRAGSQSKFHGESINDVLAWLNWFRVLTIMTEYAKNEKLAPLWEMFGPPRDSEINGKNQVIYFVNMEKVNFEILPNDPPQQLIQPIHNQPTIRYIPTPHMSRNKLEYHTPQNDDQLLAATWQAIIEAVTDGLRPIALVPTTDRSPSKKAPLILWGFQADGALQAAFLQWFFQEIAHMNITTCESNDCNNIVLPPREKFCSDRCRQREKKRRQRENKKEASN
ncbi:hypothetical protein SPSYN_02026 [Sporotomaculum syntrophicum]|uniref:Uncharacterized protein n=1 Tax=Sporotomaculum syntrophicum TaxID=182264 RepID=A0A9D2WQ41_9FIRM|nr:hypothetical protein [Sporotomaculum syntrophicum]KAF1084856.1 hypothetical protein SPSYN_02026 [Sporotomaculum syntrophicum]